MDDVEQAIRLLKKISDRDDELVGDIALLKGSAYLRNNQPTLAVASLEDAVFLLPDSPSAWRTYGFALLMKGKTDEGLTSLEQALWRNGECAVSTFGMAIGLLAAKRHEQAEEYFDRTVSLTSEESRTKVLSVIADVKEIGKGEKNGVIPIVFLEHPFDLIEALPLRRSDGKKMFGYAVTVSSASGSEPFVQRKALP